MANIQKRILEVDLHPNAQVAAEEEIKRYADALVTQSKTIANLTGSDEVQTIHVEAARTLVLSATQSTNRRKDFYLSVGSLLAGAAVQGVATEFSSATFRPSWFVFYFVIGVIGTALLIMGFFKK